MKIKTKRKICCLVSLAAFLAPIVLAPGVGEAFGFWTYLAISLASYLLMLGGVYKAGMFGR